MIVPHIEDFFAVDFPNVVHDFEAGSLGVAVGLDTADLDRQGLVLAPNDLEAPWLTRALTSQCQLNNLLGHLELTYLYTPQIHSDRPGSNFVVVYYHYFWFSTTILLPTVVSLESEVH